MEYYEFRAMNTDIVLAAEGERERIRSGFEQAKTYIEESEKRFTRFSEHSELSRLNRSAGDWFRASHDLFAVVEQALQCSEMTAGLFNPAILPALRKAGYDRSMDEIRAQGADLPGSPGRSGVPDFRQIRLDPAEQSILLPQGMQLDLGGIAKGWIAEQSAHLLAIYCDACVADAGGDMFLVCLPGESNFWQVGLEDPWDPARTLAILHLGPGAIATSSITKRRWKKGNITQHHLIDPRSGEPARTDWLSVTVIAPHAAQAEALAKALLIAGSRSVASITLPEEEYAYIAIDQDSKLWGSKNSSTYL